MFFQEYCLNSKKSTTHIKADNTKKLWFDEKSREIGEELF
jgi:hypothetical protein